MNKERVYFPNLNALRFLGAFAVIIHHVEQNKFLFGLPTIWGSRLIFNLGKVGVVLFFVLSGFLITCLLLKEKDTTFTINIKEFYLKRLLRIWPLYYLITMLAIFILPYIPLFSVPNLGLDYIHEGFLIKIALYLFFLPNLAITTYGAIPNANQLWSLGVEEQFYLFWPYLFKSNKINKYKAMIVVIVAYFVFRKLSWLLPDKSDAETITVGFFYGIHFECMAVGGLCALMYHNNEKWLLKILYHKAVQIAALAAVLVLVPFATKNTYSIIFALFFGVIILNMATNPKNVIHLENKVTNFLGKISFGLYMYHSMIIVAIINIMAHVHVFNNIVLYATSILLTILISWLSFRYFESYFLQLKTKIMKPANRISKSKATVAAVLKAYTSQKIN